MRNPTKIENLPIFALGILADILLVKTYGKWPVANVGSLLKGIGGIKKLVLALTLVTFNSLIGKQVFSFHRVQIMT